MTYQITTHEQKDGTFIAAVKFVKSIGKRQTIVTLFHGRGFKSRYAAKKTAVLYRDRLIG